MREANRREKADFSVRHQGEVWHIEMKYLGADGKVAWYVGSIFRRGVKFMRDFSPEELYMSGG